MTDALCPSTVSFLDVDPFGAELDDPLQELFQDLVHRLYETPGSNLDDQDRGVGILDMLSGGFDLSHVDPAQTVARRIEADFRKDSRVQEVSALVQTTSSGPPLLFDVQIRVVADEGVLGIVLQQSGDGVSVVRATGG